MRRLLQPAGIAAATLAFLLLLPWSFVGPAYGSWFRFTSGLLLFVAGVEGVDLVPQSQDPEFDSMARFLETDHGGGWACGMDSRVLGYLPSAIFLALWAAVPRTRTRKCLGLGLLGVQVYVLAEVATILLWRFTVHALEAPDHGHPAFFSRPGWVFTARTLYELVPGITARSLVPILLWALFALRARGRSGLEGDESWDRAVGGPASRRKESGRALGE